MKRAAAVQMRNIKLLAKEKARQLLESTVVRINEQFQSEILQMLVDYSDLKETLAKKDKKIKELRRQVIDQEDDIVLKNTRLISA